MTCSSQLGTMGGGLIALQGKKNSQAHNNTNKGFSVPWASKASKNLIIHTPSTPSTPLWSIPNEILKVIGVLFDVVENND